MVRFLRFLSVPAAYFAIVVWFLREACPIWWDCGGPIPSLNWFGRVLPTLAEYYSAPTYYETLLWLPYVFAGLVITVAGLAGGPRLSAALPVWDSHPGWQTAACTFLLLLMLALISDVGSLLHYWDQSIFLLAADFPSDRIVALIRILLPAPLLSGILLSCGYFDRPSDASSPTSRTDRKLHRGALCSPEPDHQRQTGGAGR